MASTELIGGDRPVQACDLCGGVDDHPRHGIIGERSLSAPARPDVIRRVVDNLSRMDIPEDQKDAVLAALLDTAQLSFHMDCCRANGCLTGTCTDVADLAGEHARGAALLAGIEQHRDALQERNEIRMGV